LFLDHRRRPRGKPPHQRENKKTPLMSGVIFGVTILLLFL
jgi:hypothetical protein